MKIFISGVSGVGKTTMAKQISKDYKIPFIEGSSKVLWDKYNIKSHIELIKKTYLEPQFGLDFQNELLDYRRNLIEKNDSFVSDRSPLDNLTYFLLQVSDKLDSNETLQYIEKCSQSYPNKYIQVYLGFNYSMGKEFFENDGFRINNVYYQFMVDAIFRQIIVGNWLDINMHNFLRISTWDFKIKYELIKDKIEEIYG